MTRSATPSPTNDSTAASMAATGVIPGGVTQQVRTEGLPPPVDTSIHPALQAYFAGRGIRLSLCSTISGEVRRRAKVQSVQLTINDVPEKDREAIERLLRESGFRAIGGVFVQGDTALYKQPLDRYKKEGYKAFYKWQEQLYNPNKEIAALADLVPGGARNATEITTFDKAPDPGRFEQVDI